MDAKLIECLMSEVKLTGDYHGFKSFNGNEWRLGDLLVKTKNLTDHRRIRNIGDKSFGFLVEEVQNTEEYRYITSQLERGISA